MCFHPISSPAVYIIILSSPTKEQVGVAVNFNEVICSKRNNPTEYRPTCKRSEIYMIDGVKGGLYSVIMMFVLHFCTMDELWDKQTWHDEKKIITIT